MISENAGLYLLHRLVHWIIGIVLRLLTHTNFQKHFVHSLVLFFCRLGETKNWVPKPKLWNHVVLLTLETYKQSLCYKNCRMIVLVNKNNMCEQSDLSLYHQKFLNLRNRIAWSENAMEGNPFNISICLFEIVAPHTDSCARILLKLWGKRNFASASNVLFFVLAMI